MRSAALGAPDVQRRMDRMYRPQKLIYDATRKYYLIGRDLLIEGLDAQAGETVLDLGCGTGRNLVRACRRWPDAAFLGLDPAAAMLELARGRIERAGLAGRVGLASGVVEDLDLARLFDREGALDHVMISYALSMIEQPRAALDQVIARLKPGGRLHVVDFADMAGLPGPLRAMLRLWLGQFGVRASSSVELHLRELAAAGRGTLIVHRLLGGYAVLLRFRLAS
jgi:S-adenosylmethionine-diacylgycerolhomoserine-N-methlytransferase